jgi:hypothetical protein
MISGAELVIDLIKSFPLIAAASAIAIAIRAIWKGEVKSRTRVMSRTIYRSTSPFQFWLEISLYGVTATFLVLLGLLLFDRAPDWFLNLMLHK